MIKSDKKVIKSDKYGKMKIPGEGMVYHQVELDITEFHRNNGTWNPYEVRSRFGGPVEADFTIEPSPMTEELRSY